MVFSSRHISPSALTRLFLLVVLLGGQCGLMASVVFADGSHPHEHQASQDQGHTVVSIQMESTLDVCCIDAPALVSKGVSLPNPVLDGVVATLPVPHVSAHAIRLAPSRAPPSLYSARTHTRLQIYLI